MRFYGAFTTILGILTPLGIVVAIGAMLLVAVPRGRSTLRRGLAGRERDVIGAAAMIALLAMGGSLYLSEVVGFAPCSLCWYQRIAMYPLVVVLGVGYWRNDLAVWHYALPLPVLGVIVSIYHVLLQFRPSLEIAMCSQGVPCTTRYMLVYGFVPIPLMATSAFLLVAACLLVARILAGSLTPENM